MKKTFAIVLTLIMLCSVLVACGEKEPSSADTSSDVSSELLSSDVSSEDTGSADNSESTSSVASKTETSSKTEEDKQSSQGTSSKDNGGGTTVTVFKSGDLKASADGSVAYAIDWDKNNAKLMLRSIQYAPASELGDKYQAPLSMVQTYSYNVLNTVENNGNFILSGTISSVKVGMEGPSADAYIEDYKGEMGELYEYVKNGTAISGQALESFTQRKEMKFEANVTVSGSKLTVNSFTELYTTYGDLAKHKDILQFQNGVLRKVEQYYNGELETKMEFDENCNAIPKVENHN